MQRKVRTFVAVEASPEVRSRAGQLIRRLESATAGVRWVKPEQLHMTLKFLGEVDLREVPTVCEAVARATADLPPFSMRVLGAGAFPNLASPRTIWLGVDEGADDMAALQARVELELAPLGFRREQRRFRPHLTIGRVRGTPREANHLAEALAEYRDYPAGVIDVDLVAVMSSELERTGPVYESLATAPLAGE